MNHPAILFGLEVLLIAVVLALCSRSQLIRGNDPTWAKEPDKQPYSLAKSQLAFWTVLILGAFIWRYFTRGVYDQMNDTALWLLGISSGTTALSMVVDPAPAAGVTPQPHKSFLADVLSDNSGMNIHRVQMVLWTVVFGAIFAKETIATGKFPDFAPQVFVLMGLSSGTYIWLKQKES